MIRCLFIAFAVAILSTRFAVYANEISHEHCSGHDHDSIDLFSIERPESTNSSWSAKGCSNTTWAMIIQQAKREARKAIRTVAKKIYEQGSWCYKNGYDSDNLAYAYENAKCIENKFSQVQFNCLNRYRGSSFATTYPFGEFESDLYKPFFDTTYSTYERAGFLIHESAHAIDCLMGTHDKGGDIRARGKRSRMTKWNQNPFYFEFFAREIMEYSRPNLTSYLECE